MMKFRVKCVVPPGGMYFYMVEETGMMFRIPTMSQLLTAIKKHMADNNIEIPEDLAALVEDYICRNVPVGFCYGSPEGKPLANIVTLPIIQKNTTAAMQRGLGKVSPGLARERVDVCLRCPHNDRRMCPTCIGLVSWSRRLVGAECPRDEYLGVCSVDAVSLPAKIHLKNIVPNEDYPAECWMTKELACLDI